MKISSKQANLLAREVVRQLQLKKSYKVSESVKHQLEAFQKKRSELYRVKTDAQEAINKHEMTLTKITGKIQNLYASDSINKIVEKMVINVV